MKRKKDRFELESDVAYRQEGLSSSPGWLHVRSAGYYHVIPPWKDQPQKKDFAEFFWCAGGTLRFMGEPEKMVLHRGDACFLFPGDFHRIAATEESHVYWFTFDGPNVDAVIKAFQLIRSPRPAGEDLSTLFQQLIREVSSFGERSSLCAGATAYRIISLAAAGGPEEKELLLCKRFKELAARHCRNADIGVAEYADMLHCHRSTLTRLMTQSCHITPGQYLLQVRMKQAEHLLLTTLLSIKEVASQSGFNDSNYFARVFRKTFRKNPSEFHRKT